jgi:hypothetical protein
MLFFFSDGSRESHVTTKYLDVSDDSSDNDQSLIVSLFFFLPMKENFQERKFRNSINQIHPMILINQYGIMLLILKNQFHLV